MANDENLILWKPGQSGNLKGRPPSSFTTVNRQLKDEGIQPLSKGDFKEACEIIFNASEGVLDYLKNEDDIPYIFKIIIKNLKGKKTAYRTYQDLRDFTYGRPAQVIGVKTRSTINVKFQNVSKQFDDDGNPIKE